MSDKLLHEQLREYAVEHFIGDFECGNKMIASLRDYEALALADEIERQYVPVPRFPDGEPVREGSETRYGTVSYIDVEVSDTCWGNWIMHTDDDNCVEGTLSQRVERPAPEVLGADGLPVVEGETVWDMPSGKELIVSAIANAKFGVIQCSDDDGVYEDYDARYLTHTPPDTQERIDEDAVKCSVDYWGCFGMVCEECPAEIDGEKPWRRYNIGGCDAAMVLDLLRRQRELDARKDGVK